MTEADLAAIEQKVGVSLPPEYRQLMVNFPLRPYKGTTNAWIWDDAEEVVKMNLKYRKGFAGGKPWPDHLFFIGDDLAASPLALDLSQSPAPVIHVEHGDYWDVIERWPDVNTLLSDYIRRS